MANIDYTISHPTTGNQETFPTLAEARKQAKKEDYSPVYIDAYDLDEGDIVRSIEVINKGKAAA